MDCTWKNGFNIGVVNDHIQGTIFCKLYHTLEWGISVTIIMEHMIIDSKVGSCHVQLIATM
jgi:hypothetical protein